MISRETGLHLLREMKNEREIPTQGRALINALYIIQCFHPHGCSLSLNRLRSIGQRLREHPLFATLNTKDKCKHLLSTMKTEQFLPANGGSEYYDIENSFLFSAFDGKPTIPLTLVSIFCALAAECGLTARPMGFPGEVMAHVDPLTDEETPLIVSVFDGRTPPSPCRHIFDVLFAR